MTVVVGYLPNEYGEAALTLAIREARSRGTGLLVLNTSKGESLSDPRFATGSQLSALEERLAGSGVSVEMRQLVGVDGAAEIVNAAGDVGAELIVIGIRDRSAVGKLLMGSVAQGVITHAPCPVLTVRPEALPADSA